MVTYLTGPFALLLLPAGRRGTAWAVLAAAAGASAVTLLCVPHAVFDARLGSAATPAWSLLAILATLGGFSAWARAVHLTGRDLLPPPARLPRLLRRPLVLGLCGLCAPGAGLLLAGRRRRAALALWLLWPAALATLVLAHGGALWRSVRSAIPGEAGSYALEHLFMAAAVVAAAGVLVWLVQALEAIRLTAPAAGRGHGDWYAVALGASCAVLALTADPGVVADRLARQADALHAVEMREIPLRLSQAAGRLDPLDTAHAVQTLALYRETGRDAAAEDLRRTMDADLQPYLAMVAPGKGEAPASRPQARSRARAADPADATADLMAARSDDRAPRPVGPQPPEEAVSEEITPIYPLGAGSYLGLLAPRRAVLPPTP